MRRVPARGRCWTGIDALVRSGRNWSWAPWRFILTHVGNADRNMRYITVELVIKSGHAKSRSRDPTALPLQRPCLQRAEGRRDAHANTRAACMACSHSRVTAFVRQPHRTDKPMRPSPCPRQPRVAFVDAVRPRHNPAVLYSAIAHCPLSGLKLTLPSPPAAPALQFIRFIGRYSAPNPRINFGAASDQRYSLGRRNSRSWQGLRARAPGRSERETWHELGLAASGEQAFGHLSTTSLAGSRSFRVASVHS